MNGKVKFFNQMKEFGFIAGEDGTEYYVHQTGLKEGVTIEENDEVDRGGLWEGRPEGDGFSWENYCGWNHQEIPGGQVQFLNWSIFSGEWRSQLSKTTQWRLSFNNYCLLETNYCSWTSFLLRLDEWIYRLMGWGLQSTFQEA